MAAMVLESLIGLSPQTLSSFFLNKSSLQRTDMVWTFKSVKNMLLQSVNAAAVKPRKRGVFCSVKQWQWREFKNDTSDDKCVPIYTCNVLVIIILLVTMSLWAISLFKKIAFQTAA